MKRILLRAKKSPFEVLTPEATLDRNIIGTNSGNLLFASSAFKLLSTPDTMVEVDRVRPHPREAGRINERYDAYVLPLANAFRPAYESFLAGLTALIQRLRIPVVILGVGAQSNLDYDFDRLDPIAPAVRSFARAVLDRSPSIGVRGEFTQAYLRRLGFNDVEVIGCPSMFLYGDRLRIEKRVPVLGGTSRISINVSPGAGKMGRIADSHFRRYPETVFIGQDIETLALLLYGEAPPGTEPDDPFLRHPGNPVYLRNKARVFVDPWPWLDYLRTVDFTFGTRIHGNIAALLAGSPGYVIAHDSRTLELARYFHIPHRRIDEMTDDVDAATLYREADFEGINRGHAERFATLVAFLDRHGLEQAYAVPGAADAFDRKLAELAFPGGVDRTSGGRRTPLERLRRRVRRRVQGSAPHWMRRLRAMARSPSAPRNPRT